MDKYFIDVLRLRAIAQPSNFRYDLLETNISCLRYIHQRYSALHRSQTDPIISKTESWCSGLKRAVNIKQFHSFVIGIFIFIYQSIIVKNNFNACLTYTYVWLGGCIRKFGQLQLLTVLVNVVQLFLSLI